MRVENMPTSTAAPAVEFPTSASSGGTSQPPPRAPLCSFAATATAPPLLLVENAHVLEMYTATSAPSRPAEGGERFPKEENERQETQARKPFADMEYIVDFVNMRRFKDALLLDVGHDATLVLLRLESIMFNVRQSVLTLVLLNLGSIDHPVRASATCG